MSAAMLSPIVMVFLQDKFVNDPNGVGMAYIPSMIVASMFSSRVGKLGDRYGKVKAMIMGLIVGGVAIIAIPNMSTVILLAVIFCVSCLGGLLSGPAEKGLFSEATSQESKGETYGIYSTVACLGGVAGPLLGGLLYDKVSKTIPFYIEGAVCIIAAGLVYVFFKNTVSKTTSETIAK